MNLTFPVNCDTYGEKMAYLERFKKKLILMHNGVGKWHRDGLTETQWDKLPNKVKNIFPYEPQLSFADYKKFEKDIYTRLLDVVHGKLGEVKNSAREDTTWSPDIDGDIN